MMIEACKLAQLVQSIATGLQLSEHLCTAIYAHARDLSCEGIVSKRLDSRYVSGHTNN